jgi:hypothetical protein
MASWQRATRRRGVVAVTLTGAIVLTLFGPTVTAEAASTSQGSSTGGPARHQRDASDVKARQKAQPARPGPDNSAATRQSPQRSSASQPSSGSAQAPRANRPQRKDKPPDRGPHKASPQGPSRAGPSSPGRAAGSGPRAKVGADRPDDRGPNKVAPQRRAPAASERDRRDNDRSDRRAGSNAPPQGILGRPGAGGSMLQQLLESWMPRKPRADRKPRNRDLAYRYRIENGRRADSTTRPLDERGVDDDRNGIVDDENSPGGKPSAISPMPTGSGGALGALPALIRALIAQRAQREALRYALRTEKLDHVFVPKHKLGPLVDKFGGREGAMREIIGSLRSGGLPESGPFEVVRNVGGQPVHIRGAVVDGVPKIGTAFTP